MMIVIPPVVAILIALQWLLDRIVLDSKEKIWETDGFKPYVWFGAASAVAAVVCVILFKEPFGYVWIGALLAAIFAVRGAFERRYIPGARRHVVSYGMAGLCLAVTLLLAIGIYG
ncbi:hypothetical protein [Saccharibacillus alkalitolerans]|uniref:DUF4181 domain-containing protein n=1 Tax=Saccharibacillus alkalitolerans TaxID=2705290 RepID=A0ABX0F4G1_9BACL|nr:hypothetical protein [Saccharibacillus alkalitolerans]NGZ74889.1 hypothetical protein [Saccharibacillus alkalitolerans]